MRRKRRKEKAQRRVAATGCSTKDGSQAREGLETDRGSGSLTSRAAWILFAKTVAFGLSFALPLLLVRRLSLREFGLYKQVVLVLGTALTMLPLGFGMSAYYFLPRERERQGSIVWNVLLFYMLTAGAACLALWLLPGSLGLVFQSAELIDYAPLIGVAIMFWVFSSFLEVVAVAHQEARLATIFIIASQFSKGLLLLSSALAFGTVRALIWAAIIQGALQTVVMFFYLRSRFPRFWRAFDWPVMRSQLSYAVPLGLAGVLFSVQLDLHNYFVANRFDAATYAVYAIGCFQLPLIGILSESICSVMIPRVSLLQKQDRRREIIELTARIMRKLAAIYFPLYAFLLVTGREFIVLLFTENYLASWPIFAVNLTLLPLSILVLDPILRAYAEQRYFLLRLRVGLIALLVVALWLASTYLSLVGIISVVVFASVVERVATAVRMGRIVGVTRHDYVLLKDVGKTAMASAAAGLLALAARMYMSNARPLALLISCGAVFCAVYVTLFLLSGILTREERETVRRQLGRLRRAPRRRPASLLAEGDY
ncbi:MAG TPA: oligosaccharide flippase family protein [Blastocatellia bacterium]|nr:oligosaccharide flippase family protein [Blastocatellia bacterium]